MTSRVIDPMTGGIRFEFFHDLVIGLQELLDAGAFVRAEGIIQIPAQQLIKKFSGE